jgi:predicted Zn-dependent peptidase
MVEQVQRISFATKDRGGVRALPALDGGGGLRYPLNSPAAASRDWLTVQYYGFPVDDWDRYPQEVAEVAPAEVQEIANKYIDLDHLQIVGVR